MFFSPDFILISSLGIFVIILTIWGIGRITRTQSELAPLPTAPSLVEALLPTATPAPSPTATLAVDSGAELLDIGSQDQEETLIPTVQVASGASLQIFINARQRAYLQVVTDGVIAYDGRTSPNDNLTFTAQDEIVLKTGNAAALQVYFNDQNLGVLGIFGEVVELIFNREGVIRPTKAPTPTIELQATPTTDTTPTPDEVNLPPEQDTPVP